MRIVIFCFPASKLLPRGNLTIRGVRADRLNIVNNELKREKGPPPPPTPLQFPPTAFNLDQERPFTCFEIYKLFTTIHKTKPKTDHLQALSVRSTEVSLEQLLPEGYLPHESWNQDPFGADDVLRAQFYRPPPSTLSNGMATPGHDTWYKSAKELLYDNEEVYQFLKGSFYPRSRRPRLLVGMFRRFWDHLREMGMYWDTNNEKYEDVSSDATAATAAVAAVAADAMDIDKSSAQDQPTEEKTDGKVKQTYTGNRIGTGRDMPPQYREDAVCAFVETVAMSFRCTVERPQLSPKLKLQNLFIPVPQAGIVYRCPMDRVKARRGILEGPLLAVQCNHQTAFRRQEDDEEGKKKGEESDDKIQSEASCLLREVGLMLNLAQKRAREGQKEPIPGEEKWWAYKPRWGGGPGGQVPSFEEKKDDDNDSEGPSKPTKSVSQAAKRAKRHAIENWKTLVPGPKRWDQNIHYLQIGKDQDVIGDDVSWAFFHSNEI